MSDVRLALTEDGGWFESFEPGQRWRHARGATVGEVENQLLTKLVMNTAQDHWNEHSASTSMLGTSRVVFGLITASLTVGLASQDTAENMIREVGLDKLRFVAPVFHGDTLYAYTQVLEVSPSTERDDAGLVRFKHWAAMPEQGVVFECERTVLLKRRSHWAT